MKPSLLDELKARQARLDQEKVKPATTPVTVPCLTPIIRKMNEQSSSADKVIVEDTRLYKEFEDNMFNRWNSYYNDTGWNTEKAQEVFSYLPLLRAEGGYILDSFAFCQIRKGASRFKIFRSKKDETYTWYFYIRQTITDGEFTDKSKPLVYSLDKKVNQLYTKDAVKAIPFALNHVCVDFSREGILQWLYYHNFLNRIQCIIVLEEKDLDELSHFAFARIDSWKEFDKLKSEKNFYPIIKIQGDTADIQIYGIYNIYSTGRDLYKHNIKVRRHGNELRIIDSKGTLVTSAHKVMFDINVDTYQKEMQSKESPKENPDNLF